MDKERLIEFEILKEPWNKYQLRDNSVLKTRTVLKNVRRTTQKNETQYQVDAQSLTVVHADSALRGTPSLGQISNDDILKNIEIEDMYYDILVQEFNEYQLDDGTKIKIHNNVTSISRSTLRDEHGDPIYSVLSSNQIWVKIPNIQN